MHLDELIENKDLKFIFVGGKGGVGKTTSSSALAAQLSYERKVLLISTDPAHSLGDAFRMTFSCEPTTIPDLPNLQVMEIDPQVTLQEELKNWAVLAETAGLSSDMSSKISSFQEWLSGVPGIDEATALASAIGHIESGEYDLIVFDTAPTGHTLKLLGLPEVLQAGLEKLESWQATLWGYWEMIKGAGARGAMKAKKDVTHRLRKYKHGIGKVAKMLQDTERTRFVLICIAEFLSISESKRLLRELVKNNVKTSHVIVNQLVTIAFTPEEVAQVEREVGGALAEKAKAACFLTSARHGIQSKYLADLKNSDEARGMSICEVPLLPNEVTGVESLRAFSMHLVSPSLKQREVMQLAGMATKHCQLYDDFVECDDDVEEPTPAATNGNGSSGSSFAVGTQVTIHDLDSAPQYNGISGKITQETPDGRYGVLLTVDGKKKQLAVHAKNLTAETVATKAAGAPMFGQPGAGGQCMFGQGAGQPNTLGRLMGLVMDPVKMSRVKQCVLEDPDMQADMRKKPRIEAAVKDCLANPGNAMQYIADQEVLSFITSALDKVEKQEQ